MAAGREPDRALSLLGKLWQLAPTMEDQVVLVAVRLAAQLEVAGLLWCERPKPARRLLDEIWANFRSLRDPKWRRELAERYGVEDALTDPATREIVNRIIETGREYEKTHERYSHGIRSTPTMIVNNRMIIGTLPYEQLRAIFQALVDEAEQGGPKRFIENWEERGR